MDSNNDKKNTIDLRDFPGIFWRKKFVFVITFIIVLILGILFTFLIAPDYISNSTLELSSGDMYFNDYIYEYFPAEASNLWILPRYRIDSAKMEKLNNMTGELKSDAVLNEAVRKLNNVVSKDELNKAIETYVDPNQHLLFLKIHSKDSNLAYQMDKALIEVYKNIKKSDLEKNYNDILSKIDIRLDEINKDLENLSLKSDEFVKNYNMEFLKELDKLKLSNISFSGINYITPGLDKQIQADYSDYINLSGTKIDLTSNKDYFIDRINIINEPQPYNVQSDTNYLRNTILSIAAAIILGIIAVFLANYFRPVKK
ncbi:MAG: Wzz/FepE/Etk N-terminal domain-containing protein, partial [Cyanobacteria bacterium]|nr:Wzz/FepE/Etk N-terminal domain-containing protein [Cyanobacteriota bacterium]